MQETINLFNLTKKSSLPSSGVSSIAAKPEGLTSDTVNTLNAICIAFKKTLEPKSFKIKCSFESNFSLEENILRYGVSIVIPDSNHLSNLVLEPFIETCNAQALKIRNIQSYLTKIAILDGKSPGKTKSKQWFEDNGSNVDIKKLEVELVNAIRQTKILKSFELEVELHDGSNFSIYAEWY